MMQVLLIFSIQIIWIEYFVLRGWNKIQIYYLRVDGIQLLDYGMSDKHHHTLESFQDQLFQQIHSI